MRSAGLDKNTIFVLLGDHASGHMAHPNLKEQHHIPLLIIGPQITPGIDETLGGQTDLIPTLIDLAGWHTRYASMGVSLVEPREKRSVLFARDNMLGRFDEDSVLLHNLERVMLFEGAKRNEAKVEEKLKAQVQTLLSALEQNKLITKDLKVMDK